MKKVLGPRSRPQDWKHGANCYSNHGCRCEICVAGMRARGGVKAPRKHLYSQATTFSVALLLSKLFQVEAVIPISYASHDATWPELVAAVLESNLSPQEPTP